MKKILFFMAAILTIVGCSKNDELVEQPKHEKKGNTVSVIVDNPEGGTTSRSYITTGGHATGDGTYEQDQDFTVAATADSKYHISYFYGGPQITQPKKFVLDCSTNPENAAFNDKMRGEDHTYHVGFAKDSYSLTVSAGTGGNVSGGGNYEWGKTISITANPSSGYAFDSWVVSSGDATIANASSASTTATLNSSNSTIAAKFIEDNSPTCSFELQYMIDDANNPLKIEKFNAKVGDSFIIYTIDRYQENSANYPDTYMVFDKWDYWDKGVYYEVEVLNSSSPYTTGNKIKVTIEDIYLDNSYARISSVYSQQQIRPD